MGIDRFTPGKTPVEYEHPTKRADNAPDRPQVRRVVEGVFGDSFEYRRTIPLTEARLVPVNGWKTIGGGTSREALRRAKKKAAKK